jgi:hypothetical protein
MKKILLILAIAAMTYSTAFADGLVSDEQPADSDLNWSEPIHATSYLPGAALIFDDIKTDDWFYDDVTYIANAKLMNGYDNSTFAPYDNATEAMMITVLYRMAGSPVVTTDGDEWYSEAVSWGYVKGIIADRADWSFDVNRNITRGTFACMLAAYNENVEGNVSNGDAERFPDSADIPEYARAAAGWAGESGIVNGRDNDEFDFNGEATRAELAAMLHRYIGE